MKGLKASLVSLIVLVSSLAAVFSVQAAAQALSHVYSSCYATRYEANNQVDYGASGGAIDSVFDCGGTATGVATGKRTVEWDTDYYDPTNGRVLTIQTNNNYPNTHWGDNNWHVIYIELCKMPNGPCLFQKDSNDRPW